MKKRTDFTELPKAREIREIYRQSARRDPFPGKEGIHYPDFSSIIELCRACDLDPAFFETPGEADLEAAVEEARHFVANMQGRLLDDGASPHFTDLLDAVYDYLCWEDEPQAADLIFVFGAKTPARARRAAELYRLRYSDRILVSGNGPAYREVTGISEAERYRRILMEEGVPDTSILLEETSESTAGNVRSSLNLLDRREHSFHSLILVNSPYVQRRGWCHFKKYLADSTVLIRVNSETKDPYRRRSWFRSRKGIKVILGEFVKMKIATVLNTA